MSTQRFQYLHFPSYILNGNGSGHLSTIHEKGLVNQKQVPEVQFKKMPQTFTEVQDQSNILYTTQIRYKMNIKIFNKRFRIPVTYYFYYFDN